MPSGSPPDPFNEGEQLIDGLAGGRQTLGVGVHCVPRQTALLGDGSVALYNTPHSFDHLVSYLS